MPSSFWFFATISHSSSIFSTRKDRVGTISCVLNAFRLKLAQDGKPITEADLKEVHTQKIHLLVIDQTLDGYVHAHPLPTVELGIYQFSWTPHKTTTYRMWAGIVPLSTNQQEFVQTSFLKG